MTGGDLFEGRLQIGEGLHAIDFAVAIREAMRAQVRPPSSCPAKSAFFLVRAIGRIRFSMAFESISTRPSCRKVCRPPHCRWIPAMIRWPGLVAPGTTTGELIAMEDWVPTIMAQLGQPELVEQLRDGLEIGGTEYRVHLDGHDQTTILTGEGVSNRMFFPFFSETTFHGLRLGEWMFLFTQQDKRFNGVQEQLTTPLITRLDLDPPERLHESRGFDEWQENRSWALGPASAIAAQFFSIFDDFPPRQKTLDFDTESIIDAMMDPNAR